MHSYFWKSAKKLVALLASGEVRGRLTVGERFL